jgi:lipoprotein-anchoring transpeptidase ErfK/SrfK
MRAFLLIACVAGILYAVWRWRGEPSESDGTPPAAASAADGTTDGTLTGTPISIPQPTTPEIERALAAVVAEPVPVETRAALERFAAEPGREGLLARTALATQNGGPLERWIAFSTLAADDGVAATTREAMAEKAVALAPAALREPAVALRYRVTRGDSLDRICKKARLEEKLDLTPGLLMLVNGMSNDRIRIDQELILPRGKPRIEVSKSKFRLQYFLGDGLLREYRVAIGREGRTPDADFVVEDKLVKPPWVDPASGKLLHYGEPGYALGTRWLGFKDEPGRMGFGIHGTDDPDSIGSQASLGCVRLSNADVEQLFELVPVGCPVRVAP